MALGSYLESSTEPWLKKVYSCGDFDCAESLSDYKNRRIQDNVAMGKSRPLHGQFLRNVSDTVDHNFQWSWLSGSSFKKEIEGFILACQDQAIKTNLIRVRIFHQPDPVTCHLCGLYDETVDHLLTSCSVIDQSYYKKRHDAIAKIIHCELARRGGFEYTTKRWEHYPLPVMQNACMKLLWDFTIQTDRHLTHNRADLISIDLTRKHTFLIDIAIPED